MDKWMDRNLHAYVAHLMHVQQKIERTLLKLMSDLHTTIRKQSSEE